MAESSYFITAALPYANGPLHYGHLAGVYLPADVYYRHCRLLGRNAVFISGSDEFGAAIAFRADKLGIEYQKYVDENHNTNISILENMDIEFSFFGRTTSIHHKKLAQEWFQKLKQNGTIIKSISQQPYCTKCARYVPDRYVKGTCRHCNYPEARGDECPQCGQWLSFTDLISPMCQNCGDSKLVEREAEHWYLDLPKLAPALQQWLESKSHWKSAVRQFALSLIKQGLPQRPITRHIPWGIDVPGEEDPNKKLYVWFEAPIGYLSFLQQYFLNKNQEGNWETYWNNNTQLIHFIGKDNIVFHTIVWPAMLLGQRERILPAEIPANMYVNLQGHQFSKSRGGYTDVQAALALLGIDRLRYYLLSIIPENGDSSFSWEQAQNIINGEIVNNLANFCNRVLTLARKRIESIQALKFPTIENNLAVSAFASTLSQLKQQLDGFNFRAALSTINRFGDEANRFLNETKPWALLKSDPEAADEAIFTALVYVAGLGALLQPFLPSYAAKFKKCFPTLAWNELYKVGWKDSMLHSIQTFSPDADLTIPRVTEDDLKALLNLANE